MKSSMFEMKSLLSWSSYGPGYVILIHGSIQIRYVGLSWFKCQSNVVHLIEGSTVGSVLRKSLTFELGLNDTNVWQQ